jgi:hypothetical protein
MTMLILCYLADKTMAYKLFNRFSKIGSIEYPFDSLICGLDS